MDKRALRHGRERAMDKGLPRDRRVAPYTEVNERWFRYEPGWWVFDVPTGRVGAVDRRFKNAYAVGYQYRVQFGSGGPFQVRLHDQLLLATKSQVAYAEGRAE